MKESAQPAPNSGTKDQAIKENASLELEMASHMGTTSADSGELTPVEAAILSMDSDLQAGMRLIREIKTHTAMLETAFKLMSYEMAVLSKGFHKKE